MWKYILSAIWHLKLQIFVTDPQRNDKKMKEKDQYLHTMQGMKKWISNHSLKKKYYLRGSTKAKKFWNAEETLELRHERTMRLLLLLLFKTKSSTCEDFNFSFSLRKSAKNFLISRNIRSYTIFAISKQIKFYLTFLSKKKG